MAFASEHREERAAKNQLLCRDVNERVKGLNADFIIAIPVGDWVCECADDRCAERVQMSVSEYEEVRRDGGALLCRSERWARMA